jgi:hypothetical protein
MKTQAHVVLAAIAFAVLVAPSTASAACYDLPRDMSRGSSGPDVSMLQTYLGVESVGYFGPKTEAALIAFQTRNGVPGTGYFGPLSRAKLRGLTCDAGSPTSSVSLEITATQKKLDNGRTEVLLSAKPVGATAAAGQLKWQVFVGAGAQVSASYTPDGMSSEDWERLEGSYDEDGNLKDFPMYFQNNHETMAVMQITVSAYSASGALLVSEAAQVTIPSSL